MFHTAFEENIHLAQQKQGESRSWHHELFLFLMPFRWQCEDWLHVAETGVVGSRYPVAYYNPFLTMTFRRSHVWTARFDSPFVHAWPFHFHGCTRMRSGGGPGGDSMRRPRDENSVRVTNLSEDTREQDLQVCAPVLAELILCTMWSMIWICDWLFAKRRIGFWFVSGGHVGIGSLDVTIGFGERASMQELFRPFGAISRTYIAYDRETGESRGFAFINFVNRWETCFVQGNKLAVWKVFKQVFLCKYYRCLVCWKRKRLSPVFMLPWEFWLDLRALPWISCVALHKVVLMFVNTLHNAN